MAGEKIFIGEIMGALDVKLDAVMQSVENMVTELQNVNNTVAQGVNTLNTKASDVHRYDFVVDKMMINPTATDAWKETFTVQCLNSGSFRFSGVFEVISTKAGNQVHTFGYSVNGGAWKTLKDISITQTTQSENFTIDVKVEHGDTISIGCKQNTSLGNLISSSVKSGSFLGYDLVDIVNDGALIIIN